MSLLSDAGAGFVEPTFAVLDPSSFDQLIKFLRGGQQGSEPCGANFALHDGAGGVFEPRKTTDRRQCFNWECTAISR